MYNKGKSLTKLVDNYVLVDIETTGLSPIEDDIIEIGAIKVEKDKIVDKYNTLIQINRKLTPFITNLTGITDEMLEKGKPIDTVLPEFLNFLGDQVIIGHNVNFDIAFINEKCKKYLQTYLTNDYVDTMQIAKKAVPNSINYKLGTLAKRFHIDYSNAHRGLEDVEITYQVYNQLKYILNPQISLF